MSLHTFTHNGKSFAMHPLTMRCAKFSGNTLPDLGPDKYHLDMRGRKPKIRPLKILVLMLTYACNMSCRYCCQGEIPDLRSTEMSEDVWRRAVDRLFEVSGDSEDVSLGFFGGEPFIKFDMMKKIAQYGRKRANAEGKSFKCGAMTNGLLLTNEILDFIDEYDMDLTVSFDGPPHVQNANRRLKNGGPSYDKIAERLRKLTARCPKVDVRPTVFADQDLDEVLAECRNLGFASCRLEKVSSSMLPDGKVNDEAEATTALLRHFTRQADRLLSAIRSRDEKRMLEVLTDAIFKGAVGLVIMGDTQMFKPPRKWYHCGSGQAFLTVDVKGDLYPCPRFLALPEYRMGNVMSGELEYGQMAESPLLYRKACSACWARHFCGGQCMVEHMGATGSLFSVNPETCRLEKGLLEQAVRVVADLDAADRKFFLHGVFEVSQRSISGDTPFFAAS